MLASSQKISVAKTISWRCLATFTTFLIAWAVTGEITAGLAVGGIEAITKMVLYYLHEKAWTNADKKLAAEGKKAPTNRAKKAPVKKTKKRRSA